MVLEISHAPRQTLVYQRVEKYLNHLLWLDIGDRQLNTVSRQLCIRPKRLRLKRGISFRKCCFQEMASTFMFASRTIIQPINI